MKPKTWIEISKHALQTNVRELKKIIGKRVLFLAIVKANAYGAGIKETVTATRSVVDWYGVDSLDEVNLVRDKCKNPILILSYVSIKDIAEIITKKYSMVVYDYALASSLSKTATKENPAKIHLKIDTGLSRLGLYPKESIALAKKIAKLPNIIIEGLCTHYARLLNKYDNEIYFEQLKRFNFVLESLNNFSVRPEILHTASSMAAVLYKETRFNAVRLGITLYGLWGRKNMIKLIEKKGAKLKLRPVISWKTTVINVKKISSNTGVGYRHLKMVSRSTSVAVLSVGYYDGIDKRYGKLGCVLINGKRAKIIGGIAMNMCIVDITSIKNVKIGDTAVLIGQSGKEEITAYDFASAMNTSTYEIISRINPLLPKILIK